MKFSSSCDKMKINAVLSQEEINMEIEIREGYDYREEILNLFTEYTTMLFSKQENFAEYLKIQKSR